MKKIIAAAVATAFVAPAAFAEGIGFSGFWEYQYTNNETENNTLLSNDMSITFSYAEELDNGMSVKASWTIENDANATAVTGDAGTLSVAGGFGTVAVGDNAGAMDAIDGVTAVAPGLDGSTIDIGVDAALVYIAPTVSGLSARIGTSTGEFGTDDESSASTNEGVDSASVSYTLDGLKVSYGLERSTQGGVEVEDTVTAISYSMGGAYFAYGMADIESGDTTDATSLAVTYTLNNLTFGYQMDESEEADNTVDEDYGVMFVKYAVGGGLMTYVEMLSDDVNEDADTTIVGVQYKF